MPLNSPELLGVFSAANRHPSDAADTPRRKLPSGGSNESQLAFNGEHKPCRHPE